MEFAGYIAYDDDGLIWGAGPTRHAARIAAREWYPREQDGAEEALARLHIAPATQRLLDIVEAQGGDTPHEEGANGVHDIRGAPVEYRFRQAVERALWALNSLQVQGEAGKTISSGDVAAVGDILHEALEMETEGSR